MTHGSELLGGDGAVSILVEEGECLLELCDLFLGQLIGLRGEGHQAGPNYGWDLHYPAGWRPLCNTNTRERKNVKCSKYQTG